MKTLIYIFLTIAILLSVSIGFFTSYIYPDLLPSGFTMSYAIKLFTNNLFLRSLFSSVYLGLSCGTLATLFGFLISRGIIKLNILHKELIVGFFTLPLFFPAISMFIGVHIIMLRLQIANSFIGVLISHLFLAIPYAINIGVSYFAGIPSDLEMVSQTLGATKINAIKTIVLPLISGGLGLSFCISFLVSVSEYFAVFLIGGGNIITLSGIMYPYISNFDMQNSALLSMVFVGINLVVFAISNIWIKKHSYLY